VNRFLIRKQIIDVAEIDVLLIPGLAFTARASVPDRVSTMTASLARRELRAVKIGVCFSPQLTTNCQRNRTTSGSIGSLSRRLPRINRAPGHASRIVDL
jgi:hypothetical protein